MKKQTKLPILVGPTGVGKSEVAFHLAKRLGAEILSADAYQVYKGLEIGTAQPSKDWQKEVPHHLVGVRDPRQSWTAVDFAKEARKVVEAVHEKGKPLLIVGGSGFYIRALVEGLPAGEASRPEIRAWVLERIRDLGNERAHAWLGERDAEAAQRLHPNDLQRICRALEKTFSHAAPAETSYKPLGTPSVLFLGLERSRDKLDAILRTRSRTMWVGGLLEEEGWLSGMNLPPDHPLWGAIGYQEAAEFRIGKLGESEALERLFRRTRQYAKRQWTWFKHQHDVEWIDLDSFAGMPDLVDRLVKKISI